MASKKLIQSVACMWLVFLSSFVTFNHLWFQMETVLHSSDLLPIIFDNFNSREISIFRGVCSIWKNAADRKLKSRWEKCKSDLDKTINAMKGQMPKRLSLQDGHPQAKKISRLEHLQTKCMRYGWEIWQLPCLWLATCHIFCFLTDCSCQLTQPKHIGLTLNSWRTNCQVSTGGLLSTNSAMCSNI